jgi:hypothetical protein
MHIDTLSPELLCMVFEALPTKRGYAQQRVMYPLLLVSRRWKVTDQRLVLTPCILMALIVRRRAIILAVHALVSRL